jgi:hypothetical protein
VEREGDQFVVGDSGATACGGLVRLGAKLGTKTLEKFAVTGSFGQRQGIEFGEGSASNRSGEKCRGLVIADCVHYLRPARECVAHAWSVAIDVRRSDRPVECLDSGSIIAHAAVELGDER